MKLFLQAISCLLLVTSCSHEANIKETLLSTIDICFSELKSSNWYAASDKAEANIKAVAFDLEGFHYYRVFMNQTFFDTEGLEVVKFDGDGIRECYLERDSLKVVEISSGPSNSYAKWFQSNASSELSVKYIQSTFDGIGWVPQDLVKESVIE